MLTLIPMILLSGSPVSLLPQFLSVSEAIPVFLVCRYRRWICSLFIYSYLFIQCVLTNFFIFNWKIVFKAAYGFGAKLDSLGVCLALGSCMLAILINNDDRIEPTVSQWVFPCTLALGGLITFVDSKRSKPFSNYGSPSTGWDRESDETMKRIGIPLWGGVLFFLLWIVVLVVVIIIEDTQDVDNEYMEIFETMYRIGSIIFGGGQVSTCLTLPMEHTLTGGVSAGLLVVMSLINPLLSMIAFSSCFLLCTNQNDRLCFLCSRTKLCRIG